MPNVDRDDMRRWLLTTARVVEDTVEALIGLLDLRPATIEDFIHLYEECDEVTARKWIADKVTDYLKALAPMNPAVRISA